MTGISVTGDSLPGLVPARGASYLGSTGRPAPALNNRRREERHELTADLEIRPLLEGPAEDRDVTEQRHLTVWVDSLLGHAADHEPLALLDEDLRLGLALVDGGG